jgi:hypothetical protein
LTFVMVLVSQAAMADEAGVSFWLPGFFGSLAAAPQQPGWSLADIYYHDHVSAGGDVNGVDMHLDWGASQFLSKQILVGPVGYVQAPPAHGSMVGVRG